MRTVLVLPSPPRPQGGAADRCFIGLHQGLLAHGVEVDALAADLHDGSSPTSSSPGVRRVHATAPTGTRARLAHLRRPLGDISRTPVLDAVRAAAAGADLLHLETSLTAWLDEGSRVPTVMSLHYRARLDRSPGVSWQRADRELLLFCRLERLAIRRYRWLVASSGPVADAIRSDRPGADVTVVSLCLDPSAYPAVSLDVGPRAGIIGTATWPPTADALGRLLGSVWPAVRSALPEARLVVAGRGTAATLSGDSSAGVEVVGEVASTQEFLAGLSALLYPARRGSGMKVKVLEAMASGLPVVTTTAGAEGVAPGDGVIVADDERAFVRATVGILADADERRERGVAAHRTFLEHHAPGPATAALVDLYGRILG